MHSGSASTQPRYRPEASSTPLAADTQVDGYRVKRLLAEGAMGEVYSAVDEQLGRQVALKFIKASQLDERGTERFLDEARATARFNHPHIVTVYAVGRHGGRPNLALEFLDGETLRERLEEKGALAAREAMRITRAVAEAVAEAHRRDIIHADLKPENVVLPKDGRIRVVDFGLARFIGTSDGGVSGTPAYMAPERWQGAPPGPAVDIWSLGTLLHELIEGRRPLSDRDLADFAYAPRPVELGPTAREAPCAELLRACLSPQPDERPTAEEVSLILGGLLEQREADLEAVRSPFRGLTPFAEADSGDFHGRSADIDAVAERLRGCGLVPVVGPSGVGKSSFVYAGLVPRLKEGDRWTVVAFRPGRRPLWSLAAALSRHTGHAGVRDIDALAKRLGEHPGTLAATLRTIAKDGGTRVLVFADQFEETFTLGEESPLSPMGERARERGGPPQGSGAGSGARSDAGGAQLAQCLTAAASVDDPWRLVIAMRDDFLNHFAANDALRPALAAVTVLGPLARAALVEAVEGPLRRVGFRCDAPELTSRIAVELEGKPAALPLLQFACHALWERRDAGRKRLLVSEYEAMGGASGALAAHAQRVLAGLPSEERALVRALVLRVVNADGTRRPRTRTELLDGLPADAERALERLLEQRLLVASQRVETGEGLVELAHEALATAWPALARWLSETQEERQLVEDVERAAALWKKRGRPEAETWSGKPLAQALQRIDAWSLALSSVPREFLDAAQRREERTGRRRRLGIVTGVTALALIAVTAIVTALAFKAKERQAIAQQAQIRLAAADLGEFELVLAPFDWDPKALEAIPVSAATLPELSWALHAPDIDDPRRPGRLYGEGDLVRQRASVVDGELRAMVEARSGPVFLDVTHRGPFSPSGLEGDCGASQVFIQRLPGYTERGNNRVIRISVPTCQATRADVIEIPGGPFLEPSEQGGGRTVDVVRTLPTFAIDRTEVTSAQFDVYGELARLTGDARGWVPSALAQDGPTLPATGISAWTAGRFCRFFGKRLPTLAEWQKAARGGLTLDTAGLIKNPAPARSTPWAGPPKAGLANLDGKQDGFDTLAPAGSLASDVSPYGVMDLAGNLSEWTVTPAPRRDLQGLRAVAGGHWGIRLNEAAGRIDWANSRAPAYFDFATGVRCALE